MKRNTFKTFWKTNDKPWPLDNVEHNGGDWRGENKEWFVSCCAATIYSNRKRKGFLNRGITLIANKVDVPIQEGVEIKHLETKNGPLTIVCNLTKDKRHVW